MINKDAIKKIILRYEENRQVKNFGKTAVSLAICEGIENFVDSLSEIDLEYFERISKKIKKISFWYMTDTHFFIKPEGNTLLEIEKSIIKIAKENPWGMACPAIIVYEDDSEDRIGIPAHTDAKGKINLKEWHNAIINDKLITENFPIL
jgi:hypothetical protein